MANSVRSLAPLTSCHIQQVKEELQYATFTHTSIIPRLLARGGFSAAQELTDNAREQLRHIPRADLTTPQPQSHPLEGLLLPTLHNERDHFAPFITIYNQISSVWLASVASEVEYRSLVVYGGDKADDQDEARALNPHLDSFLDEENDRTRKRAGDKCHWDDVGVILEVRNDLPQLVAHAGRYAQKLLSVQPTRTFALIIGYTPSDHCVRFLFFHRGGLHSSPPLELPTKDGLDGFIQGVIVSTALHHDLMSWTLWKYPTVGVPTFFPFKVDECLHQAFGLTGRCTTGHALSRLDRNPNPIAPPESASAKLPMKRRGEEDPFGNPKKRKISTGIAQPADSSGVQDQEKAATRLPAQSAFHFWQHAPLVKANVDDNDDSIPPLVFAKDTWAPPGYTEVKISEKMSGEFGAAELWAHQVLDSNEFFYEDSDNISPWYLFARTRPKLPPARLVHVVMYFSSVGKPLHCAKNVHELLTAIFHAMLAHYALFKKHNILHRDVSYNNIMLTAKRGYKVPPIAMGILMR
ncbi:hypothetical protein DL93DRAFT_1571162 [Clavulina sp. PMI_390]|nr:hypothetical protein DL93DRAFT_1571162 [Clavulina sp. PMI_390]